MRIGELAQACGVSRDTLRFYEARGLISAQRRANGYRDYPVETVQLMLFIRNAQRLGFSLEEIGSNVDALWQAADPDQAIRRLLTEKLALIEERLLALQQLRDGLRQSLTQQCPLREVSVPA
ncbi:MerR family transcriptional regulator [Pseudomonas cremoricolorata]|uniref:MerR family transcriptional regulator n=1 Tax=Pseudomonas cremoricolorata TaxID=157783 RepID=A0A089WUG0_9PSED|nr:MerR family transcriptional regulator [Pseudomonas cremoricolorata]AIR90864.1 MerR family transcriptional regulator [Pseudomonas cremoricolorata]